MIKNVDFSKMGHNPDALDYIYILKKKIDEIVDHLNLVHGEGQFHMSLLMNDYTCGCQVSMEAVTKEESDEVKEEETTS
jgi:hypothetical protein